MADRNLSERIAAGANQAAERAHANATQSGKTAAGHLGRAVWGLLMAGGHAVAESFTSEDGTTPKANADLQSAGASLEDALEHATDSVVTHALGSLASLAAALFKPGSGEGAGPAEDGATPSQALLPQAPSDTTE